MKKAAIVLGTLIILLAVNYSIYQKENVLGSGETLLLKLAPKDPRSLIQGDYMVLRYDIARTISKENLEKQGKIVLETDENNVAIFKVIYQGAPLAENEFLLNYKDRNGLKLGAESFLFQEGDADLYSQARYGMLKVDKKGNSVLAGLCDEEFQLLGKN
jgi:uncharacterized membrane-anchored protein